MINGLIKIHLFGLFHLENQKFENPYFQSP